MNPAEASPVELVDARILSPGASKVVRFEEGFHWEGRDRQAYKSEGASWHSVCRTVLAGGEPDQPGLPFHVRYFEVGPGGYTSLEKHEHEHVVVVLRGQGRVRLGAREEPIWFGDVVYVAPWEVHQFLNAGGAEPVGFLCIVAAERDRPVVLSGSESACELPRR